MLAGTAGFAAAEVALSGYAEIGILATDGGAAGTITQFHQDVEVTFTMSGETDGGLSFGAAIDLDETNVAAGDDSGTTVFVSGSFGKVTMGDTDGALDWAVADAGSLTSMGDDHTTHVAYFSANGLDGSHDGQVVRYEYAMGDFGVAVSYEQANNGNAAVVAGVTADDNVGIGATYSMDMSGTALKFGLGYQAGAITNSPANNGPDGLAGTPDDVAAVVLNGDVWGASVSAEMANGFAAKLGYTSTQPDTAGALSTDRTGLGLTYTTGALSMHVNYGDVDTGVAATSFDSYGLAVNYDLGGGAVVMAGYGSDVAAAAGNQAQYSIGLGLSF
ncbi:porin [Rhodobacteraceae bacterium HSP-20]|uniref:Porin n=1 Tax=Paragemmobacter amnigenus TaxID=2852097 RepID=A0ABS6J1X0_9RHOB|nr:porin [Rhodobacter amnigenus]MBU9697748.1 porin [Rhodobacter amnigenus]MBV4388975.1 porin [Rhodobacter amnigenus]